MLCGMLFCVSLLTSVPAAATADASPAPASPYASLAFRNIGPGNGGRIDTVAGVPGDPLVYFAGGLGGLWRSSDGGFVWKPVFDDQPLTSIGAIAVAPSAPRVVYVGTGEPNVRNDIAFGDGMWRSSNGGTTWEHRGLDDTAQIAQLAVDPHDARVVYVAAVGDPFKAGPARGIYKTTDGGATWRRVLFGGNETGASSVVISPANPRLLFGGLWTVQRRAWSLSSGGPNDGLYRSTDGGERWTRLLGNGFPNGLTGRIGLAFAPSRPTRIYALIESQQGVLWRSDDSGSHWKRLSRDHRLAQRPFYFSELAVDPKDADHVWFMSVSPMESLDGGKSVKEIAIPWGGDYHQAWIDPASGKRILLANDGGIALSLDGGATWSNPPIIASQAYHVSADDEAPYVVCGVFQDGSAGACGPSNGNSLWGSFIQLDKWFTTYTGESGWIVFSPRNHNIIYGSDGDFTGRVARFDRRSGQTRTISPWPEDYTGHGASDFRYRTAWVAPLAVSPLEPDALYYGANVLLKTIDGGQSWVAISPDLTRDDKSKQLPSGGPLTHDNGGAEVYDTIASIAPSPLATGEIWLGTDDGKVWLTRNSGARWDDLTANVPGLPAWARVSYVDASPFDEGTAYLVADAHKLGDRAPYLYATHDYGMHWTSIASNLPRDSYARMIRHDPTRRGMLYVGTETGLWISFDGGLNWQPFQNNLPRTPVYDFVVQPHFDDLVVGTHGRGIWIFDDLSALQQFTSSIAAQSAYLFPVRSTYRWSDASANWASSEGAGQAAPSGAVVNFYLRDPPKQSESVRVDILDGATVIRELPIEHPAVGINRVVWDLNYETLKPVAGYRTYDGFFGPEVTPGTYTIRLVVEGLPKQEQTLRVLPDPETRATLADMREQFAMEMHLRDDYVRSTEEIAALLALRKAVVNLLPAALAVKDVALTATTLLSGINNTLATIYQSDSAGGEDILRYPVHLYERIPTLAYNVASSDDAPTAGERAVAAQLDAELSSRLAADDVAFGSALRRLNAALVKHGFAAVVSPARQIPAGP